MRKTDQFTDTATANTSTPNEAKKGDRGTLRQIEIALLVLGLVLAGIFIAARVESRLASQAALKAFEDPISAPHLQDAAGSSEFDSFDSPDSPEPDFSDWDEQRVRSYRSTAATGAGVPLAVLEIPRIHLVAPVQEGTDGLTLNHAVGRIAGTALPGEAGNIGLAAHRDGFFRGLKDIAPGDTIELRTRNGKDIYAVDRLQIVTPRNVEVLQSQPRPSLTLVTCYPFYYIGSAPKRFVVTAYLTQHTTSGPTTSETRLNPKPGNSTQEEQ